MKHISNYYPCLIILAGTLARLVNIGHPFWYDEAFTKILTGLPLGPMVGSTAMDMHPPFYYLLEQFSPLLPGTMEIQYRLLSVVCSVLSMVIFWLILRALNINRAAALIALAVMALAPDQIYYAQEARMYALLGLLVLVQVWAGLTRRWVLLEVTIIATVYTHNYGLVYSAVICAVIGLRELAHLARLARINDASWDGGNVTDAWRWMACYIIPPFAYAPWFAFGLLPQLAFVAGGHHWIQSVTPGDALIALFWAVAGAYYPGWAIYALFMAVLAGLVLVVIYAIRARHYSLLALAFAPWLIAWVVSLKEPIMLYRALVPAMPFLYILIGLALVQAAGLWRWIGSGLVVLVIGVCLGQQYYRSFTNYHDYHLDITAAFPAGVPVVHLEDTTLINFTAYHSEDQYILDAGCPEQLGAIGPELRDRMELKTIKLADLPKEFYFVASVNPLSTACHESTWQKLSHGAKVITETKTIYTTEGIYYVSRK